MTESASFLAKTMLRLQIGYWDPWRLASPPSTFLLTSDCRLLVRDIWVRTSDIGLQTLVLEVSLRSVAMSASFEFGLTSPRRTGSVASVDRLATTAATVCRLRRIPKTYSGCEGERESTRC